MASQILHKNSSRPLPESSFGDDPLKALSLESIRDTLVRIEDSIVFALIERARFPLNSNAYDASYLGNHRGHGGRSIAEVLVRETEVIEAQLGRYQNPEEIPFFAEDLAFPFVPTFNYPQVLYPAAASVNVSKDIWDIYFKNLLPLFASEGDDGDYASAAAADLVCLQVLSRRIHYGRQVAEVKFRDAPQDYIPAIQAKDRDTLMKLLTFESVEEMVKRRVEKKAKVFGQDVTLNDKNNSTDFDGQPRYKVDPSVVVRLYSEWVIPLTKVVEVDYLLRRLD
ncbi:putative chorismate mutase [Dioscorea sansibarensis]